MSADIDPFVHHPELRDKVRDPSMCWARNFNPSDLDERLAKLGAPPNWRYTDARREHMRREILTGRTADDLWLFAYGSLMWDPGVRSASGTRSQHPGQSPDLGGELIFVYFAVPGTLVHLAAGTTHWFRFGECGGRMVSMTARLDASRMFPDIDREISPVKPDLAMLVGLGARHDLTVAV